MWAKNMLAYVLIVGACCVAVPVCLAVLTVGTAALGKVSMMDRTSVSSGKAGHHAGHAKTHRGGHQANAHRHHGGGRRGIGALKGLSHA